MSTLQQASDEPPQCSVYFSPAEWSRRYATTFFTSSLTSYAVQPDGAVSYTIHCRCVDDSWDVQHRFSDFERLLQQVRSASPPASLTSNPLPSLPAKVWTPSTQDAFSSGRQPALQAFLDHVLQRKEVCRLACVREFLRLDTPLTPAPPPADDEEGDDTKTPADEDTAAEEQPPA